MSKVSVMPGSRFGRLVILEEINAVNGRRRVTAKCDCGKIKEFRLSHLTSGATTSCKCLQKERVLEKCVTHGLSNHPLYSVWGSMKTRCYNRNEVSYKDYGGRGIIICDEWRENFQAFYDWSISNGWKQGLQIDRINNNGNYSPENCRYTTIKENTRNRRSTVMIEYNGETKALSTWAEQFGIDLKVLWNRIYELGMSIHDALHYQPKISKVTEEIAVEIYNSNKSTSMLAKQFNLNSGTVWQIKNGNSYKHFTGV